jgi:hypothetical protein
MVENINFNSFRHENGLICFSYNCRKHIDVVDVDALVGVMAITVTDSQRSIDYCSSITSLKSDILLVILKH